MQLTETNINDIVFTTSTHTGVFTDTLKIAEVFGKKHKNVLSTMDRLIKNGAIVGLNSKPNSYTTKNNRTAKMYQLDREGFLLLTTSFTGANADRWRAAVIKLFIKQEQELMEWRNSRETLKIVHPSYTDQVKVISQMLQSEGSRQHSNIYPTIQRQINKAVTHKPTPRGADNGQYRETLSTEHLEDIKWFENFVASAVGYHVAKGFNGRYIRKFVKDGLHNYYRNTAIVA